MDQNQLVLNGQALAAIGGVLSTLVATIAFLFRLLMHSKEDQLRQDQNTIDHLRLEIDAWRDRYIRAIEQSTQATQLANRISQMAKE